MKRSTAKTYAEVLHGAYADATPADRPKILTNFIQLLNRRRALKLMPRILDHLQRLADTTAGLTRVQAWSAADIDTTALSKALHTALGKTVVDATVDANLIGGLKVQIGDTVVDGTLRSRLQRLHTYVSAE